MALAGMEIKLAAVEIVRQLTDIELLVPTDHIRCMPIITTHPIADLPMTFRRRES